MDPELLELLERLSELSLEERNDLLASLTEAFDENSSDEPTDESLALLGEIADAIDTVRASILELEIEQAARVEAAARLAERVRGESDTDAGDDTAEEETEDGEEEAEEENEEGADAPEAIAAASAPAPRPARTNARRPRAHAPQPRPAQSPITITAAGDVPGYSPGQRFATLEDVGRAFSDRLHAFRGSRGPSANVPVARFAQQYPEDRVLQGLDASTAGRRIDAVTSPQAITASGGLCAPVAVDYSLMTVGSNARPVRDSLAQFDAGRGGIRFIAPPVLTDLDSSVGVWTEANDANPTDPTVKPCLRITCGDEVEETIDAITQCLEVGNFSRRTFPEQFTAWWGLAATAHARLAERTILTAIGAGSTNVTTGQVLGAARDILENLDQAGSQMRNRHRMLPGTPLRAIFPAWALDMIRADLVRELPGSSDERLATADAKIQSFFSMRNINVTWALEGETGQDFAAQGAGALLGWKTTVVWYLFPEGSWLFLDGGSLDFGVNIVDTSMIETNDSRAFLETFEAVAMHGPESLRIASTVCPDGSTSATIDISPCTTGS